MINEPWILSTEDEEGEEIYTLNQPGRLAMAHWVCEAYQWGGWDWDLICAGTDQRAVDARFSLAHWMNEQGLFDVLYEVGFEEETYWDDEAEEWHTTTIDTLGTILLTFFFEAVKNTAADFGVTCAAVVDDPVRYLLPDHRQEIA